MTHLKDQRAYTGKEKISDVHTLLENRDKSARTISPYATIKDGRYLHQIYMTITPSMRLKTITFMLTSVQRCQVIDPCNGTGRHQQRLEYRV
jgi:hypothetical protein